MLEGKEYISMRLPIMSRYNYNPEHGPLISPVEWPKGPTINEVDCSCCQYKDHKFISGKMTQQQRPRIVDPAILGNGSSGRCSLKWRLSTWVEVIFFANPINTISMLNLSLHFCISSTTGSFIGGLCSGGKNTYCFLLLEMQWGISA